MLNFWGCQKPGVAHRRWPFLVDGMSPYSATAVFRSLVRGYPRYNWWLFYCTQWDEACISLIPIFLGYYLILSYYYIIILSYYHTIILSYYHLIVLSHHIISQHSTSHHIMSQHISISHWVITAVLDHLSHRSCVNLPVCDASPRFFRSLRLDPRV